MPDNHVMHLDEPGDNAPRPASDEGGLRAPPGLGFWGKAWWWFHFLILVKLARLRFIGLLLAIGLVIVKWDTITAYYERATRPAGHEHAAGADVEYYCPMHPTVIRDNPKEKCPICFMPLSKRKKGEAKEVALPPGIVNRVQLSPYRVVLADVQTWKVSYLPLSREIITVGSVEFNEREMKHIAARVEGRIDALFVNETGQMVQEGQELASLYSAKLYSTMRDLLYAHQSGNKDLQRIANESLTLWGISQDQIDEVLKTGKANTHLKIRSPIDGHVLKKYVKEGQYVSEGSPLYDVVDLSTVWIEAQVYEEDMAFLPFYHNPLTREQARRRGIPITATTRAFPGHTFEAHLTFVFPHVDQDTRTVTVRFELPNPGHKLRPGTSATVKLKVPPSRVDILDKTLTDDWAWENFVDVASQALFGPGRVPGVAPLLEAAVKHNLLDHGRVLAVPESAVIDTGSLQIVYRETGPGEYEGVKVQLGPRMVGADDVTYYPVLKGLQAGDLVVTMGSFLVDAETRLNPAAGSIYFGGSSGSKGLQGGVSSVRPSTPADEEAKVKAALAKLSPTDRHLAEAQEFCPVLKDSRLGSMGMPIKVLVQGRPVFVCCDGCTKAALDHPRETLEKVEKLKKAKAASGAK
jgi:Cu(I)/Ag(I) efflux system membrane fusion protein